MKTKHQNVEPVRSLCCKSEDKKKKHTQAAHKNNNTHNRERPSPSSWLTNSLLALQFSTSLHSLFVAKESKHFVLYLSLAKVKNRSSSRKHHFIEI